MPIPPKDLARHVDVRAILERVGIQVKGVSPAELIDCPYCKKKTSLGLIVDPQLASGARKWFYCSSCFRHGDMVQLASKLFGLDDIGMTVRMLSELSALTVPADEVTRESIDSYKEYFLSPRARFEKAWEQMTDMEHMSSPKAVRSRQRFHLYEDYHRQPILHRFMGCVSRTVVQDAFRQNDILPKGRFECPLVLNYQDIQGRCSAVQFIDHTMEKVYKFAPDPLSKMHEGGLAMLDAINPYESTVYAMGDFWMALYLQKQHLRIHDNPLKVVVYNELTSRAWRSVNAERVVMWAPQIDVQIFMQARLAPNTYIATHPKIKNNDPQHYVLSLKEEDKSKAVIDMLNKHAEPWHKVLAQHLLDPDMGEYRAKDLLEKLNLNGDEKKRLLDSVSKHTGQKLEALLGETSIVCTLKYERDDYVAKNDGVYKIIPSKGEEQILDALVRVHSEIFDPETQQTFWEGAITYANNLIYFKENFAVIETGAAQWLSAICKPYGTVQISPRYRPKLGYLLQRINEGRRKVTASSKIGIHPDGKITFPKLLIQHGEFKEQISTAPSSAPAKNVSLPTTRTWRDSDVPSPLLAAYTALTAGFITNLLAPSREQRHTPILVVGSPGSVSMQALRHLTKVSGMNKFILNGSKDVEKAREELQRYPYPTVLETSISGLLSSYPPDMSDNVFLTVDDLEAAALSVHGRCAIMRAPQLCMEDLNLPPFDDILYYLAELQKNAFVVPDQTNLIDSVLQGYCEFLSKYLNRDCAPLHLAARRLLYAQLYPSDACVEMFCALYGRGLLKLERLEFMDKIRDNTFTAQKDTIILDETTKKVFLSRNVLVTALKWAKLPVPDLQLVTEDFLRRRKLVDPGRPVEGWVIEQSYFEGRVLEWQRKTT